MGGPAPMPGTLLRRDPSLSPKLKLRRSGAPLPDPILFLGRTLEHHFYCVRNLCCRLDTANFNGRGFRVRERTPFHFAALVVCKGSNLSDTIGTWGIEGGGGASWRGNQKNTHAIATHADKRKTYRACRRGLGRAGASSAPTSRSTASRSQPRTLVSLS